MKAIFRLCVGTVMMFYAAYAHAADANIIATKADDYANLAANTRIPKNEKLDYRQIEIKRSLYLENNGYVTGDIFVSNGSHLVIQNSGLITGTIHLADNAYMTQLVTGPSDLTNLRCGQRCTLLVRGASDVRISDIMAIGVAADKIILMDAHVILDVPVDANRRPIETAGEVIFALDGSIDIKDGQTILSGVNFSGGAIISDPNSDGSYTVTVKGDVVGTDYNGIIDYARVITPQEAELITILMNAYPDDKLPGAIMAARSNAQIRDILDNSVHIYPIKLMNVPRTLDMFEMNMPTTWDTVVGIAPFSIFGSDMDIYGGRMHAGLSMGPVYLGMAGYYGVFGYEDQINKFDGMVYGANLRAGLNMGYVWFDAVGGMSITDFDVGPVIDGDEISYDPRGQSIYGRGDIGTRFMIGRDFSIMPFVGIGTHWSKILDNSDSDLFGRVGAQLGYVYHGDGMNYSYSMRGAYGTNNAIDAALDISILSVEDGAGGGVALGAHHDDWDTSYLFKIHFHMQF